MTSALRDLRVSLRMLLRSPRFTLVAVLVLALGIGVNSAIFNVADAVLLQPPPVEEPERLVAIFTSGGSGENPYGTSSYPDYLDLRDLDEVFSGVAAFSTDQGVSLGKEGETDRFSAHLVSGNFFRVMGVGAAAGRVLGDSDDESPGAHPVLVLSKDLAQRRFASGAVDVPVRFNGRSYTVVGVAPEGFRGVRSDLDPEMWLPLMQQRDVTPARWGDLLEDRGARWIEMVGRLKPGVSTQQAEAAVRALGKRLQEQYPDSNEDRDLNLLPLEEARVDPAVRQGLERFILLLVAVAVIVLLITCMNVGNLILVRAIRRQKEIALRLALGGRRIHLVRQFVVEAVLLALAGSALGLVLVLFASRFLSGFDLQEALGLPMSSLDLGLDLRLVLFTAAVTLVVGVLLGLVPLVQAWRKDFVSPLKDQVGLQSHRRSFLRGSFIVAEVALSCVLLIAALLIVRSLLNLQAVDPGFRVDGLVVASVDPSLREYDADRGLRFLEDLRQGVEDLAQVKRATFASYVPVEAEGSREVVTLPGQLTADDQDGLQVDVNSVGPGFFETFDVSLVQGRGFEPTDDGEAPPVAVVNQTLARLLWPGRDAIGNRVSTSGPDGPFIEVVGVAANSFYRSLREEPRPYLYRPLAQRYDSATNLVVWGEGRTAALVPAIRDVVRRIDPDMPLFDVRTQEQHLAQSLARERLLMRLLIAAGLLALVLAAAGLYGVISYMVAQRTREIGIRVALGASARDVLVLVIRGNVMLIAVGLGLGLVGSFWALGSLSSLLFGLDARDPVSVIAVLFLLGMVALFASYLPARRAMAVQPTSALRYE